MLKDTLSIKKKKILLYVHAMHERVNSFICSPAASGHINLYLFLSWIEFCEILLDKHFTRAAMKNSNQGEVVSSLEVKCHGNFPKSMTAM